MLKKSLEFNDKFPDDQIENGDEIIRPGGFNCSNAIAIILYNFCTKVTEPQIDDENNSWQFYANYDGNKFLFFITDLGALKLLQSFDKSSWWNKIRNGDDPHKALLSKINSALLIDDRFTLIQWVS